MVVKTSKKQLIGIGIVFISSGLGIMSVLDRFSGLGLFSIGAIFLVTGLKKNK